MDVSKWKRSVSDAKVALLDRPEHGRRVRVGGQPAAEAGGRYLQLVHAGDEIADRVHALRWEVEHEGVRARAAGE